MNFLIVRLGALGDIVHTVPAAAALRAAYPSARIDWVVDARHAPFVELVECVDRVLRVERPTLRGWTEVVRDLRRRRYDVALDFQGLMKSAVIARASGAARVIGFSIWHLREKGARAFYSDVAAPAPEPHVVHKNLRLLGSVAVTTDTIEFPLAERPSAALASVRAQLDGAPFALVNPGAAWPNKRWPPERFGRVASFVHDRLRLQPYVIWGPGERALAERVVSASGGAARLAPATTTGDLVELARAASLMISGDTGPLHIAGAAGTPLVALFGPTDPSRNGPWAARDVVISRYTNCRCHYQRRCRRREWCLEDVTVAEVTAAVEQRLGARS